METILAEYEAKDILGKANIPILPVISVCSMEETRAQARNIGYPVVLKLSSLLYPHKTEIGGVLVNIREEAALDAGFATLSDLRQRMDPQAAIIIEAMAPPGVEFFVGFKRDAFFGPVISLGPGGIWLELLADVTFRLLPASRADFLEMLIELKSWPKLEEGFRNLPPVGPEPLLDLLEQVNAFCLDREELQEMDLNPVVIYPENVLVVDARMVLVNQSFRTNSSL